MINTLIVIGVMGLSAQAFIGLSFLISCIWEKETRATTVALLQFIGMMVVLAVFIALAMTGAFHTPIGKTILIIGYAGLIAAAVLLLKRSSPNPKALEGTEGLIVGEVKQHDEREIVFARNRSLRPGSEQFEIFYREHPEYREYDEKRRALGGPLGHIGSIDNPNADINNAMMFASLNIPLYLGDPPKICPERHPALKEKLGNKKIQISPREATKRIKGYTKRLGASLVGITELNSLWIYSNRGEIFRGNREDWGKVINVDHKYVIVFAEEMDFNLVSTAPHTPTSIESSTITLKVPLFLHNWHPLLQTWGILPVQIIFDIMTV